MKNVLKFFVFVLLAGCFSAPQSPQVSLTENVEPVNFFNTTSKDPYAVIASEQQQKGWQKQFIYSIEDRDHTPAFFYAIAHADQIIANIKPPFVNFIFKKLQADLRRYGITTPVDLVIRENKDQKSQVILKCVKFSDER